MVSHIGCDVEMFEMAQQGLVVAAKHRLDHVEDLIVCHERRGAWT